MKKDTELKLPDQMLREMQYEDFKAGCINILELDNEEIEASLRGRECNPEDVRRQYKKLYETITPEEFNRQKKEYEVNSRIKQGNELYKSKNLSEALEQFNKALDILDSTKDDAEQEELKVNLSNDTSFIYMEMKNYEMAIKVCNKVLYLTIRIDIS